LLENDTQKMSIYLGYEGIVQSSVELILIEIESSLFFTILLETFAFA